MNQVILSVFLLFIVGALACDVSKAKEWADAQWNCVTPSCSSRVPAGSGQPSYECAEFAARSLAYGGCIDIDPHGSQSSYESYKYGNLLMTTGLGAALDKLGFKRKGTSPSSVGTGCAVVGNGGDGSWSHAAIGVDAGVVDAHNNARYHLPVQDIMYLGINEIWCP